jgi:hypothetical protein
LCRRDVRQVLREGILGAGNIERILHVRQLLVDVPTRDR